MRLWLDDLRPMPIDFDWHAHNYDEAITFLKTGKVSIISFDHDLGEEKSGYDVACWIEKETFINNFSQIGWEIHSMNPVGIERLLAVMRKVEDFWHEKHSTEPTKKLELPEEKS